MQGNFILIMLSLCFLSCAEQVQMEKVKPQVEVLIPLEVPTNEIHKSALHYDNKTSLWTVDSQLFSGYAVSYFPNGTLSQKFGILAGKKQNEAIEWYPNGTIKYASNYYQGKLHGAKKAWSADASPILLSSLNYHLGKAHGIQKKWYPTGELFKILQLTHGKEEGIQQAFRKNGDLFANYEARNGRIFGLKKASLCYGLEDGKVEYPDN